MSKIEVDAIDKQSGSTLTLGGSGTAVTLGAGATQTGFGRTGTVNWQTSSIKTATFTASDGEGYFANTTGGAFNMNLPAGTAGAIVAVKDYANTFDSNTLTIVPNGSDKIGGVAGNYSADVEGLSITLIFLDSTRGWTDIHESTQASAGASFICASVSGSGNTLVTADTNFKVATFTGPGTFTVNSGGGPLAKIDYMVIAGGGGGGTRYGGGGAAGGFRESKCSTTSGCWTASPRATCVSLSVVPGAVPITVGAGGAGSPTQSAGGNTSVGTSGSNSIFSTITSAGGGGGASESSSGPPSNPGSRNGAPGGSGGGSSYFGCEPGKGAGGAGNVPSVNPAQGFAGGNGGPTSGYGSGGGGGATAVGTNGASPNTTGVGGAGATNTINGTPTQRAGGGGGGGTQDGIPTGGAAGAGGGGAGGPSPNGLSGAGTANTGGGGGAGRGNPDVSPQTNPNGGGTGGSGIVIIRYKFQ